MLTRSSTELFEESKKFIPGGVNSPVRAFKSVGGTPFTTEKARGATLVTSDGNVLIDFVGTWGPAIHGHNHPTIRKAIAEALDKGTSFGTPNPYEVELAKKIVELVPSIEKVRMVNSGTEATMTAIRLARGYTGRDKIIKFIGCYHGHVDSLLVKAGSGALTFGTPDSAGVPASFANETVVLPFNDIEKLEEAFKKFKNEIAGVILEPYPANCGLIFPDAGYLKKLRELCTGNGAVLIFDEVITGFRVALGGVQEQESVTPDLTTLGKIIGGGLPVGAFGGKAEIMECLSPEGPVYQAGTLSGNPLAMTAGITSLRILEEQMPYGLLDSMGKRLTKAIKEEAQKKGLALQMPQVGSMFAFFFSDKPIRHFDDVMASNTELFKKVFRNALDNGVYLPPSPFETCFISTAHAGEPIEKAIEVLQDAIRTL